MIGVDLSINEFSFVSIISHTSQYGTIQVTCLKMSLS